MNGSASQKKENCTGTRTCWLVYGYRELIFFPRKSSLERDRGLVGWCHKSLASHTRAFLLSLRDVVWATGSVRSLLYVVCSAFSSELEYI